MKKTIAMVVLISFFLVFVVPIDAMATAHFRREPVVDWKLSTTEIVIYTTTIVTLIVLAVHTYKIKKNSAKKYEKKNDQNNDVIEMNWDYAEEQRALIKMKLQNEVMSSNWSNKEVEKYFSPMLPKQYETYDATQALANLEQQDNFSFEIAKN